MEITIPAHQIIGNKVNTSSAFEAILLNNSRNKIGNLNYNIGGKKGFQLSKISDIFCDNFLFYSIVQSKNCVGLRCSETGALNSKLVSILKQKGLSKIRVKAVGLERQGFTLNNLQLDIYEKNNKTEELNADDEFFKQIFKIACADERTEDILEVLNQKTIMALEQSNYYLCDIDFTQDFKGSFCKAEIIEHLRSEHGFKLTEEHGDLQNGDRIIIDNDKQVGKNCLTFLEQNQNGELTRWKIYNKFAQSLESASVRSSVGAHIIDWLANPEERLAKTIPKSIDYGFTRLEITYYGHIPTRGVIDKDIETLLEYIPKELAYKTPIKEQWKAFTENLQHTLFIYNEKEETVLMGWAINELTRKITGVYLNNCSPVKLKWLMTASSLHSSLPIDVIYIDFVRGKRTLKNGNTASKETITDIKLYAKSFVRNGYEYTNLIHKNSIFYYKQKHTINLEDFGLVETPTFKPFLPKKQTTIKNKPLGELIEMETSIKINVLSAKEAEKQLVNISLKQARKDEFEALKEKQQQELALLDQKRQYETAQTELYNRLVEAKRGNKYKFTDIPNKTTVKIIAISPINTRYGETYFLLGMVDGNAELKTYWADPFNKKVLPSIISKSEILKPRGKENIIFHEGETLIIITKIENKLIGTNIYPYCNVIYNKTLPQPETDKIDNDIKKLNKTDKIKQIKEFGNSRNLRRMDELEIGNSYKITAIGRQAYRSTERYIFKLEGEDGLFICNYWLDLDLSKLDKKRKTLKGSSYIGFVLKQTRTTKQKARENQVALV